MNYSLNEVIGITERKGFANRYNDSLGANPNGNVLLAELLLCLENLETAKPSWFDRFDTKVIVDFLVISHGHYLNSALPVIERHIESLTLQNDCPPIVKEFGLFFYNQFAEGLKSHFEYEEKHLFPFVLTSEDASAEQRKFNEEDFKQHHPHPPVDLKSLLMLVNGKSNEKELSMSHRILLDKLNELDRELSLHEFIEENVLMTRLVTSQ